MPDPVVSEQIAAPAEAGSGRSQETPASRPPDGPRHQPWCSRPEIPAGADRCPRCACWQPSNRGAVKFGATSRQALTAPAALATMADKRTQLYAHLGQPSVIQADLVDDYATLDVLIDTVSDNIAQLGVFTAKGRARAGVSLLLQLLDRRVRYAGLLGLRSVKDVGPSAQDIMRDIVANRGRTE